MSIIPARPETLWTLFTGPVVWAFHFLFCYLISALWCAKHGGVNFAIVQAGIGVATFAALVLILISAWLAWRQWCFGTQYPPHDASTAQDRQLFQGFATLLLSGLSFIAVLYVALPAIFIEGCVS